VLAAIQAAVTAAMAPLQREVEQIGRVVASMETSDTEDEEEEPEMLVDARPKRPLESASSSIVTLRRKQCR
jgi:hypothetical protein